MLNECSPTDNMAEKESSTLDPREAERQILDLQREVFEWRRQHDDLSREHNSLRIKYDEEVDMKKMTLFLSIVLGQKVCLGLSSCLSMYLPEVGYTWCHLVLLCSVLKTPLLS